MLNLEILKKELFRSGLIKIHHPLPQEALIYLENHQWDKLDQLIFQMLSESGKLKIFLQGFRSFTSTEHIIAIRNYKTDEDGIWHDDGSRHMAFTWSLNEDPITIQGGELLFRKYGEEKFATIAPPPLATLIIFLTGEYGFEHKVCQVTKGERKTIAGWCS